jgi:hypothetical protein
MSSVVGGLCPECWRENADVIDSFSITVAPTMAGTNLSAVRHS